MRGGCVSLSTPCIFSLRFHFNSLATHRKMAVTHNDLSSGNQNSSFVSSQRGLLLMVFSVLCGFCSFILCLAAEATRSEATWLILTTEKVGRTYQCFYSGSGKTPLTCSVIAFFALAVAMFTEHAFILITISDPRPPALVAWTMTDDSDSPSSASALTWQACFLFFTTWVSFAVAEVLLMIGIGIESGHLTDWRRPRANCISVRQGLFAAAGVFGLTTVFLAAGLYLTALRAQRLHQSEGNTRRRQAQSITTVSNQQNHSQGLPQNPHTLQANQPAQVDMASSNKTSSSV